jgi:VWFA-related protein
MALRAGLSAGSGRNEADHHMRILAPIRPILFVALSGVFAIPWQNSARPQALPGPQTPTAPAQQKEGQATPPTGLEGQAGPEYSISVESALVNLDVLVADEDGRVLGGLKKENFRILDNGRPQGVTNFATTDAPLTIVMLLEYSGIAYDYFAYKSASWASGFVDSLDAKDWVALVTYDMRPRIVVDFTHSKGEVLDALPQLSYPQFRESNMFDAINDTLDRLERIKGKKSILLIATGADTFSQHTLDQTYRRLKETDATMFCVGVAESEYLTAESSLSYIQAKNQLRTFAKLTGGLSWFPRFEGELPDVFASVGKFLRNQYRIGFSPPDLPHDGKYHRLKVEIVGADGKPLVVKNEKGKRRKVEVFAREGYVDAKQPAKK